MTRIVGLTSAAHRVSLKNNQHNAPWGGECACALWGWCGRCL